MAAGEGAIILLLALAGGLLPQPYAWLAATATRATLPMGFVAVSTFRADLPKIAGEAPPPPPAPPAPRPKTQP